MRTVLLKVITIKEILFTVLDCAKEDSMSQEEFEKCLEGCERIQGQPLKTREWSLNNQFQRLDRDESGALTKDEFQLTIKG